MFGSRLNSFLNWSMRVGRMFGIPIDLHISLLFFLLPVLVHRGTSGLFNLEATGLIIFSILLHELGHALTARRFGLRDIRILLHGFGGLAFSTGSRTPIQQILICLAGPAVTFGVGILGLLIGSLGTSNLFFLIHFVGAVNILLGFLNLVPSLPFDGGQALQGWFTRRMTEFKAMRRVGHIGLVVCVALLAYGLLGGESYFEFFGFIGLISSYMVLQQTGGIRFSEFAADRRAKKEMEQVMKREKMRRDEYLDEVNLRQREREANERLRKLLEDE